jgi:DNA-directed RNA polymerase
MQLVLQISQERRLLYPLLRARIHEGLSKILAHQAILPPEDICMALDSLDMIGSNALRSSNVAMSEDNYVTHENEKRSKLFHDENYVDSDADDCPSDIEDEGEKAIYRRETRKAIRNLLVLPSIISKLTVLLEVPHAQIFLGSVMVLHKFASTQGYNHVLIEIIALAGRPLEKIVENLQSDDDKVRRFEYITATLHCFHN